MKNNIFKTLLFIFGAVLAFTILPHLSLADASGVIMAGGLGLSVRSQYSTFDAENLNGSDTSIISLRIINSWAADVNVELFNWLKSITKINNTTLWATSVADTAENIYALVIAAAGLQSLVYFDDQGDLIYVKPAAALTLRVTCTTQNLTYRQIWDSTCSRPFRLTNFQMVPTNDPQINNEISFFYWSRTGKQEANSVQPAKFKDKYQFQSKIIDIPVDFNITDEHGISFKVNSGEDIMVNLSVS